MNELLLFDEPRVPSTGSDNLFVGLLPPREVAGDISDLSLSFREMHHLRGNPRPARQLHITLFHVGNFAGLRAHLVAAAQRACASAAALSRAFPLQMDEAACFGRGSKNVPLVLKIQGRNRHLDLLFQRLVIRFALEGLRSPKKAAFEPHVTLAYIDKYLRSEPVEAVGWMVEDLVLIHSLMGKTQYIELGRWKLGA